MKDETATLASYGLLPSSKVILMGTKPDVCDSIHNHNIFKAINDFNLNFNILG